MSPGGQAKLLRVWRRKTSSGSAVEPIHTDARVIAATNQNLVDMVRAQNFARICFFRLNVVTLELPPLRAWRRHSAAGRHFLAEFCRRLVASRRSFPPMHASGCGILGRATSANCETSWSGWRILAGGGEIEGKIWSLFLAPTQASAGVRQCQMT